MIKPVLRNFKSTFMLDVIAEARKLEVDLACRSNRKFEEIQIILQKLADMSFFKALLHFEDINREIALANRLLADCSQLFPVSAATW